MAAAPAAASTSPPKPPDPIKTFASIVAGHKSNPDIHKSFSAAEKGTTSTSTNINKLFSSSSNNNSYSMIQKKKPAMFKGEPAVFFTRSEIETLAKPFEFTLVGKFPSGRPALESIRKVFTSLNLKSEFHIGLLDPKHILIRLENEIDYHRIWLKEQWSIFNYPMRVLKWTPNFDTTAECPIIPTWILLPSLPVHLFERASLYAVAQNIGKPLQVDTSTATLLRPSVARVCVEVDMTKSLPKRVWVGYVDEDEGYWQTIQYEQLPKYCKKCCSFDHEDKSCGLNQQIEKGKKATEIPSFEAPKSTQHQEQQWVRAKHQKNNKGNNQNDTNIPKSTTTQATKPQNSYTNATNNTEKHHGALEVTTQILNSENQIGNEDCREEEEIMASQVTPINQVATKTQDLVVASANNIEEDECAKVLESDTSAQEIAHNELVHQLDNEVSKESQEDDQIQDNEELDYSKSQDFEVQDNGCEPKSPIASKNLVFYEDEYDAFLLHRIEDPYCTPQAWKMMQNEGFKQVVSKKNKKQEKSIENKVTNSASVNRERPKSADRERPRRTHRKPARLLT